VKAFAMKFGFKKEIEIEKYGHDAIPFYIDVLDMLERHYDAVFSLAIKLGVKNPPSRGDVERDKKFEKVKRKKKEKILFSQRDKRNSEYSAKLD